MYQSNILYLYIVVKTCYIIITAVANVYKTTKERYAKGVLQTRWFWNRALDTDDYSDN